MIVVTSMRATSQHFFFQQLLGSLVLRLEHVGEVPTNPVTVNTGDRIG